MGHALFPFSHNNGYLCNKIWTAMLHYISFGSGSSGNCSCLYTERTRLLIDAGLGTRTLKKWFYNYNIHPSDIDGILVTHDHTDHAKSAGSLSHDFDIPVYTTAQVHAGMERNWCLRRKIASEQAHNIEKGVPFHIGDLTVTAFGVPHDSADNVGYCVEHEDVTFVLMTDIGHVTEDIKHYISKANYLVIEADYETEMLDHGHYPEHLKRRIRGPYGHMSNDECAKAIIDNATPCLRHVWLCHLSNENNHPDLAETTVRQTLRAHGIVAGDDPAADFKLDVLRRKTPSPIFNLQP